MDADTINAAYVIAGEASTGVLVLAVILALAGPLCVIGGQVQLQGRAEWRGAVVSAGGMSTTTQANGLYLLRVGPGAHTVVVTMGGYLSAETTLAVGPGINALPPVRLLAGDLNGDGCVDIADMEIVSAAYATTSAQGDVNADGVVDIADAALVAGNYGLCGPIKF
jgi:hypothetical protein